VSETWVNWTLVCIGLSSYQTYPIRCSFKANRGLIRPEIRWQ
jgi:hypothetical protein